MKKSLLLALSLAAFTLIPAPAVAGGKPPAGCGSDDTSLSVIIDGVPGTTMGYNVYSDGQGPYVSSKKISLAFQKSNCTYDFVMNLSGSTRTMKVDFPPESGLSSTTAWFFNFDRIASVPITEGNPNFSSWCSGGVQKNQDGSIKSVGGYPQDVYAPCGVDTTPVVPNVTNFARRNVGFGLAGSYDLRFQNSPIDSGRLANDTALVRVYHPDAKTWYLESDDYAYHFSDYVTPTGYFTIGGEWGSLLYSPNSGTTSEVGKYVMPFRIAVTRP